MTSNRATCRGAAEPCVRRVEFSVVDDEADIAHLVARALSACGMAGCWFTEPAAFLAEAARKAPNLVVLDLSLRGSDACAVMRQLAALRYRGSVLLMSGWLDAALRESERVGTACGLSMLEPLPKPFRLDDLYLRVARVAQVCASCRSQTAGRAAQACR